MKSHVFLLTLILISSWCNAQNTTPFVLGHVDQLYSKELSENRILNIYLPEGYAQNDSTEFDVIYLLDGSADEDFVHVAGLVQYNSLPWVNRLPPSILVGIANTDRRRDFSFPTSIESDKETFPTTGGSARFMAFIEKELQPFIKKNYKTSAYSTIIGQSLGGLLATEILFKKPTLFDQYIIISPSLWWDNGSLLTYQPDMLKESYQHQTDIYIGVGKEGLTPGAYPRVMEVDANLLADLIQSTKSKTVELHFDYLPDENHATIMHQALVNAFMLLNKG